MNAKHTQAELEANMRMKGKGPSKAELAKLFPDLFGTRAKTKKSTATAKKKKSK